MQRAVEPDHGGEVVTRVGKEDRATRPRGRRPFVVQVGALRKDSGGVRREVREGPIEGLGAIGVSVPDDAPICCELTLSSHPAGILVTGTVSAPWTGECRRCGGPVDGVVHAEVHERYASRSERVERSDEDEAYPFDGDELDLEPLVRDAVLLDLPLAPLCSPECRGICPRCGENWNVTTCACPQEGDPRWAALDALRGPEGGSLA